MEWSIRHSVKSARCGARVKTQNILAHNRAFKGTINGALASRYRSRLGRCWSRGGARAAYKIESLKSSAVRHDERRVSDVNSIHGQIRKDQRQVVTVCLDGRFVERNADLT
jgi:hypothetical protein